MLCCDKRASDNARTCREICASHIVEDDGEDMEIQVALVESLAVKAELSQPGTGLPGPACSAESILAQTMLAEMNTRNRNTPDCSSGPAAIPELEGTHTQAPEPDHIRAAIEPTDPPTIRDTGMDDSIDTMVRRCRIRYGKGDGIKIYGGSGIQLEKNDISHNGQVGVR